MFWKKNDESKNKNVIHSSEYETILKRLLEGDTRAAKIENDIKLIKTDLENLRGNFNRKLSGIAKEHQEEQKPVQTENFNNSNEVPFG